MRNNILENFIHYTCQFYLILIHDIIYHVIIFLVQELLINLITSAFLIYERSIYVYFQTKVFI